MISPVSSAAYDAARTAAGLLDRSDRGRLLMTGADRRSYLQGLLTNDVAGLGEGRGCYAAYLTPQGRMIADLFVYELGDAILISTVGAVKDQLLGRFDELVFAEDVQVRDATATHAQIGLLGPGASRVLAPLMGVEPGSLDELPEHGCRRLTFGDAPAIVTKTMDTGVPGFDAYVGSEHGPALTAGAEAAGAVVVDPATAETLRVEAGIPLFGRDMTAETIPLEAGIEDRAISFTKGCYVGQEVIIRVLHRGHGRVARKLVGLRLAGPPAAAGASVVADGREVGLVTSSVWSPAAGAAIALAYVPRDRAEPGTVLEATGGRAEVIALPVGAGV